MFEPLITMALRKLDIAVDAYLERQQIINLLAIPGTIMFLLLFWAFSGAGGAMLLLGVFLTSLEIGGAIGLFLLRDKYHDQLQEWNCAADAIEAQLTASDAFDEWTEFLQNPASDPKLEQIREQCQGLPDQYPPQAVGDYCGPEGIKLLQANMEQLRVGIASKAYEDFMLWRAVRKQDGECASSRRLARKNKKKDKKKKESKGITTTGDDAVPKGDDVMYVPNMSGAFLEKDTAARIDREAEKEARREAKEVGRAAKKDARVARKATRRAVKEERKLCRRAATIEARDDEMVLYQDDADEEPVDRGMQEPRQAPMQPPMQAPMRAPTQAPMQVPTQPSIQAPVAQDYEEAVEDFEPVPPPPVPKRRRPRGLTESAALQQVMQAGLTAHHYDETQHQLIIKLGREPKPAEVLKALTTRFSKKTQKRAAKMKARQAKIDAIQQKSVAKRPSMRAFRIDSSMDGTAGFRQKPVGRGRAFARVVFVFALLAGAPFVAWRVPRPETQPLVITGEVHHQILDHAPDIQHQLRTPFEQFFGNKPVMLMDGQRLYVNAEDYVLCWPESWEAIYEKGYSVVITAEVKQLIFGGFSVASISSAEQVDPPVATTSEFGIEPPSDPPQRPRRHRRLRNTGFR